ncbi:MAG: PEGA domain-containing protein [Pseudomonadota bacterium]
MSENPDDNLAIEPTPFQRATAGRRRRRLRPGPVPVLIGLTFVLLAMAAAFMFLASAVRFDISPQPTAFSVTEGFFSYPLGGRYLMLPGVYRIQATLEGYEVLYETVEVTREADQMFAFAMQKLPGILTITSTPSGVADVYLDQALVGTTPLTLDAISPGLHDISLRSDRYRSFDTEIDIEGRRVEQTLQVDLEPAWAEVSLTSLPAGAQIQVDGEPAGVTPATVEMLEGTRQVQVRQQGYKTWQTLVDVVAGVSQTLPTATLVRADGTALIKSEPSGANVTIEGQYRGQTPLELKLPPGAPVKVVLSRAGFVTSVQQVQVRPEEDVVLNTRLEPVLGVIRLRVEPDGTELLIDGQSVGTPGARLELPARSHELEIRKPGYAPFTTSVTPQPGLAQQLFVQLKTEEQARVDAIAETITASGLAFRLIIPDALTMGAGRREPGRRSNEIEKTVKLTRPYYLSTFEVSNALYRQFDPSHDSGILWRSVLTGDDRPVVNISWDAAARFCNWLSEQEGLPAAYELRNSRYVAVMPMNTGYRLPTEAEWAYAARYADGPTPSRFPWGNAMPPTGVDANYADISAANMVPYHLEGYNDTYRGTSPVGSFKPNAFGIHDLAGNVSEWIHDYYSIALEPEPLTDPAGPAEGQYHVVRGSNFTHGRFSELRWTYRDYGYEPKPEIGFRVARYLE